MAISHRQNRLLPRQDKEYFLLWVELGTTEKVSKHLALDGEVNPRNGEPFHPMTIHRAAMRYVIENDKEAKPLFDKEQGRTIPNDEWEEFVIEKACKMFRNNRSGLKKWLRRHQEDLHVEKYKKLYEDAFYAPIFPD